MVKTIKGICPKNNEIVNVAFDIIDTTTLSAEHKDYILGLMSNCSLCDTNKINMCSDCSFKEYNKI